TGEVTIGNAGDVPGAFTLSASGASGPLAGVLDLRVVDATASETMFAGKLATFTRASLGTFAPGASRRYRFELAYPNGPAVADNALQGATTSVQFDWDAAASGGAAGPNPTPVPATPTPAVTAPAAAAPSKPAATAPAPATTAPATTAPVPSSAAL